MTEQLNFRSFFHFLGRNRLYTFINLLGLAISLMFVILIADYTMRGVLCDDFHTKADRIRVIHHEGGFGSGYYLQQYLLERYPEIEMTCAVSAGDSDFVKVGNDEKLNVKVLYADSTFFRMFDFELLSGDREQAFATRSNVILSESFARKVFGSFNPLGQPLRFLDDEGEDGESDAQARTYVVSGIMRDIDRSVIPKADILVRAERLPEINGSHNKTMDNAGSMATFLLVHEQADIDAKIPDMLDYFKEIYWLYSGNVYQKVLLTPLRKIYFADAGAYPVLTHGNWGFVSILFAVGAVILFFAMMNYVNLTVAQTGFRAKEMATRRLLGSSRAAVVCKLLLESTCMCAVAFLLALWMAVAAEPYVAQLFGSPLNVMGDLSGWTAAAYAGIVVVLGVVSGLLPAAIVSRFTPIDVVKGAFSYKVKALYGSVLIVVQNVITIALLTWAIAIALQIRHLVSMPMGYNTEDIIHIRANILHGYPQMHTFREELLREPCVEAVAMGCGTPHDRGNNNTMYVGPERMVSFQTFIADSVWFRMLGLELIRDNHINGYGLNQYALRELGIDEDTPNVKMGTDYHIDMAIGGIYRDFQVGTALDKPTPVMLRNIGDFDRYWKEGVFRGRMPWSILVKTRGDKSEAFAAVAAVFERLSGGQSFSNAKYIEDEISGDFDEQRRLLRIVSLFSLVAILISVLGLLAMSLYYIRQRQEEVAVRKVFGSTRGEVLKRLVSHFMLLVGVAFVIACPIAWYVIDRWLEEYSERIAISPLIFLASGVFAALVALATVWWQSCRAADANPVTTLKS